MGDINKVIIELTLKEAKILCSAIAGHNPPKEDEMISFMLYTRIKLKINETADKNEFL